MAKPTRIYSIQSPKFNTIEEARHEFLNIYANLRYANARSKKIYKERKDYIELSAIIGLSEFDPHLVERIIVPAGKNGGRKIVTRRNKVFANTSLDHRKPPHLHIYLVGTGASTFTNKIIERKNKEYGRKQWTKRTRNIDEGLPYWYVKNQSVENGFRCVGHPLDYPDKYSDRFK